MAFLAFGSPPASTAGRGRRLHSLLLVLLPLLVSACAGGRARPGDALAPAPEDVLPLESGILLGEELRPVDAGLLGGVDYDLPVEANSWVEKELEYLLGQRKELIESWMARGHRYRPFIEEVLRENGLPTDLFHLAMIESGFVPTARSRAGAAGMWQFMPATAGDVGLRVDRMVDERLDPIRSTRAAARHLRSLYRTHEDWALATAAYNAGSGRISRGLREFGAHDFWELAQRGDLAEETRQYVPRLYAVTILARGGGRFGLDPTSGAEPLAFDSIFVEYETPLAALAAMGPATAEELSELNPHLLEGVTPAGGYWVWVPAGAGPELQRAYLASSVRAERGLATYTVRWGDSLSRIARVSEIAASRVRELNPKIDFDRLLAGAEIRLPAEAVARLASVPIEADEPPASSNGPAAGLVAAATVAPAPSAASETEHRVEPGESLWTIARAHGVSIEAIQEANEISGSVIVPGQRLVIPGGERDGGGSPQESAAVEYRVEAGDTLWDIARRYGSSIEAIRAANDLGDRAIQPGQVLTVPR